MRPKIAVIHNEPLPGHYEAIGEKTAVLGVLEEVEAVLGALTELGYPVVSVSLPPPLETVKERLSELEADVVFNLFEGFDCCPEAEASVAAALSELGMPYTGCPGPALSLALDKVKTKTLLLEAALHTPRYQLLDCATLDEFELNYPCIVKPPAEDASHGLSEDSVVSDFPSLEKQVARVIGAFGGKALVEEYLDGREFNATVLGTKELEVLPISEIVYTVPPRMPRILTFLAKWDPDSVYSRGTTPVCPADIRPDLRDRIRDTALSVFRLLGCSGYARVDFRLDVEGRPSVLEANPNCDISPGSGAALQARAAGLSYTQFIEMIILLALETQPVMTPSIRPMAKQDKSAIMHILRDTPEFKPAEVAVAEEVLDSFLHDPTGSGYRVIVAETGSNIVGYLAYGPTPLTDGTWDLYWAAVARNQRGRAIGTALISFVEDDIRNAGGRLALIETSSKPEYEQARRFHRKMGYELACRIPDFYAPGDDKLVFQKRLARAQRGLDSQRPNSCSDRTGLSEEAESQH